MAMSTTQPPEGGRIEIKDGKLAVPAIIENM